MAEITVWRVVAPEYAATAYSGDGAHAAGGRFNRPGRRCVYAAASLALAMLEVTAHLGAFRRLRGRVAVPATLDDALVTPLLGLPEGWDARPYGRASQDAGDAWLASGALLAVRVSSVVVPVEANVLINPAHPAFADAVRVGEALPVPLEPRLAAA